MYVHMLYSGIGPLVLRSSIAMEHAMMGGQPPLVIFFCRGAPQTLSS